MTVPIIPGPQPEDEPTRWQEIAPVMGEPYRPPSPQPTRGARPSATSDVVPRAALGTVTVVVTLIGLLCVLPLLFCFGMAACGAIGSSVVPGSTP